MSCFVFVEYAGSPMLFPAGVRTTLDKASAFTSEGEAWYAAYQAGLSPNHCRVREKDQPEIGTINQKPK